LPHFEHQGNRLFFRERGEGAPVLLLPGNTASSASLEEELDHFGRRFRAVSFDYPGTGRSGRIDEWPEDWWERCADAAAALVEHLGDRRAAMIGASGGAIVALLAAIRRPDRARAVVADSFVLRMTPEFVKKWVTEERARRTEEQVRFWTAAHGPDWEQPVGADGRFLERFAGGGGDPFGDRLSSIGCPALLTASSADPFLPGAEKDLLAAADRIPECASLLADRGGHPLMWTRPTLFRSAADGFLDRLT